MYRPIADYALIGDCHSAALVSRGGSIDWCCLPRFDADSCFARLLDHDRGGHCEIVPHGTFTSRREYRAGSLVLCTTFTTRDGEVRLTDFFAMRSGGRRHPWRRLVRIVEGLHGCVRLAVRLAPRFDYGAVKPWIYRIADTAHCAVGGNAGLLAFGDIALRADGEHDLCADLELRAGERVRLALQHLGSEDLHAGPIRPDAADVIDRHLDETLAWWHDWSSKLDAVERPGACTARSAIVLKALTYAPTGAVIAAPTTSLPEDVGGERNWDYRYSWLRDSVFTVGALARLGCAGEADAFRRFIQRTAAGEADSLQVLYGIDGRRRLTEVTLDDLEGWRGSRPVRIGNAADRQFQSDVFGLLLELAWRWSERGNAIDEHYWDFLVEAVDAAIDKWPLPDQGIWEIRAAPRHFVHSKVMCWVAVSRGIQLAERQRLPAPLPRWRAARDAIREAVMTHGVDHERGNFVASFGSTEVDAALLLLPDVEFVGYDDPLMVRTAAAIGRDLDAGGLVLRYRTSDGLRGSEGVFLCCSFWLAECLARQGRVDEARARFERAAACANDVGLFSEEYAPASGDMLGNFPQGLTHLAHMSAALALG
jgi:GH15 family glucan-1,4-alpha-glucosidase